MPGKREDYGFLYRGLSYPRNHYAHNQPTLAAACALATAALVRLLLLGCKPTAWA